MSFEGYPRPSADTGIGVHDPADWTWHWGDIPEFIDLLKCHKISWYMILGHHSESGMGAEFYKAIHYVPAMLAADIIPIVRIFKDRPHPDFVVTEGMVRPYTDRGVKYIRYGNEMDLPWEWPADRRAELGGWHGDQEKRRYDAIIDQALRNHEIIRNCGGIPVLTDCLIVDENIWPQPGPSDEEDDAHNVLYNKVLYYADQRRVLRELLEGVAVSVHNRPHLGRPIDYPYDHPDPSKHSRSYSFNAWMALDEVIRRWNRGQPLPIVGTEAGVEYGWSELNRTDGYSYGPVDWTDHHAMNMQIATGFRNGLFPEALFCQCFWVLREDRQDSPFKHAGLWHNLLLGGEDTPFWRALGSAADWVRQYAGEEPGPQPTPTRIIDLRGKLAVHPWKRYERRAFQDIDSWMVHHVGAGDTGMPPYGVAAYLVGLGYPATAYTYFIGGDGTIFQCLDLKDIAWHSGRTEWNKRAVSVCLAGNFLDEETPENVIWPTKPQVESLAWLLAQHPEWQVKTHGEVKNTRCAGLWFYEWREGQEEPPVEDYEAMYFKLRATLAQAREIAGVAEGHLSPLQDSVNDMAEAIGDLEEVLRDV